MTDKLSEQNIVALIKQGVFQQVIVGNISKYEAKSGQYGEFYNFSVGVQVGSGQNKDTVWFDCTANDDYQYSKGDKVIVFGRYSAHESANGKVYHKLNVNFSQALSRSKKAVSENKPQETDFVDF